MLVLVKGTLNVKTNSDDIPYENATSSTVSFIKKIVIRSSFNTTEICNVVISHPKHIITAYFIYI